MGVNPDTRRSELSLCVFKVTELTIHQHTLWRHSLCKGGTKVKEACKNVTT